VRERVHAAETIPPKPLPRPENFRRAFELDPSIDGEKISAKIDQGVVTLTLPKAEQVKPRKIAVA